MQTPVKQPMHSSDMAVTVFISSNDLLKDKQHHRAAQKYIKNTENRTYSIEQAFIRTKTMRSQASTECRRPKKQLQ